jgi:hypothetical protein
MSRVWFITGEGQIDAFRDLSISLAFDEIRGLETKG